MGEQKGRAGEHGRPLYEMCLGQAMKSISFCHAPQFPQGTCNITGAIIAETVDVIVIAQGGLNVLGSTGGMEDLGKAAVNVNELGTGW
jgi:hypothetical protein